MTRKIILIYALILLITGWAINAAFAASGISYLEHPIPEQIRARAEAMVRTLRPNDPEQAVAGIRTTLGAEFHPALVLLRIEADCRSGKCMTVIASNDGKSLTPELIVSAGNALFVLDYSHKLWGIEEAPPMLFEGEGGSTIKIQQIHNLWVVQACADCFEWSKFKEAPLLKPKTLPVAPVPAMKFDEFRRFIGR